jgi:CBS domain-containing protein
VRGHAAFLHLLAQSATQAKPPLGLLAGFAAKDAPGAPHSINLKANGARIFVDAARALALAKGVHTTNTAARLRAVLPGAGEPGSETNALIDAFYYIQQLRLRRQASAPEARAGTRAASEDLANRIDPDQLNPFEQSALKEAFRFARLIQNRLELDFRL